MRTVVLGAGVIGVTTAFALAEEGHEVVLVEGRETVALETSAVNAGLITPGHAFSWASPQVPMTLWRSLLGKDTSMRMHWKPDFDLYRWGITFMRNCTTHRSRVTTLRRLALSQYSLGELDALVQRTGIEFHRNAHGALFLHRTQEALESGIKRLAPLKEHGEQQQYLDADQVAALEPAFAPVKDKIAGGIYSPTAISGDSSQFAANLAMLAEAKGVQVMFDTRIEGFVVERGEVTGVRTSAGVIKGDRYVLCLGIHSRAIGRTIGLSLPIYPVKGYTMNAPVKQGGLAPQLSGIDEGRLVAWSRFGDSMRMTGTADFTGYDTRYSEQSARSIFQSGGELFPDAVDWDQREMKVGLRPVTSNELPLIGPTQKHQNVVLNTGHGNLGWTMAAGSARITADLIQGRIPRLDPVTFGIAS